MQNQRIIRTTAWVTLLVTVIVTLFSVIYLGKHIEHDCTGEDCPVCTVMVVCAKQLKTVGMAGLAACAIVVFNFFLREQSDSMVTDVSCISLVSQKVRMNN